MPACGQAPPQVERQGGLPRAARGDCAAADDGHARIVAAARHAAGGGARVDLGEGREQQGQDSPAASPEFGGTDADDAPSFLWQACRCLLRHRGQESLGETDGDVDRTRAEALCRLAHGRRLAGLG